VPKRIRKPLESCVNGCGIPPSPPSLVICGPCQDKITDFFRGEIARWDAVLQYRAAAQGGTP